MVEPFLREDREPAGVEQNDDGRSNRLGHMGPPLSHPQLLKGEPGYAPGFAVDDLVFFGACPPNLDPCRKLL